MLINHYGLRRSTSPGRLPVPFMHYIDTYSYSLGASPQKERLFVCKRHVMLFGAMHCFFMALRRTHALSKTGKKYRAAVPPGSMQAQQRHVKT